MLRGKKTTKKSPVKLVCKRPFADIGDDMLVCRWKCPTGGGVVQFRHRKRKDLYAILHPSTKRKGRWQLTSFDDDGPIGDVERATCEEALYDGGITRDYKIEAIG